MFKRACGPSWLALIATGGNTVLAHHRNTAKLQDGDLVQFDYAPDYKYYQSDVTRLPANGTFHAAAAQVYTIYLRLYQALMTSIKVHAAPREIIRDAAKKMDTILASYPFTDARIKSAATAFVDRYRNSAGNSLGPWVGMEVHDVSDPCRRSSPSRADPPARRPTTGTRRHWPVASAADTSSPTPATRTCPGPSRSNRRHRTDDARAVSKTPRWQRVAHATLTSHRRRADRRQPASVGGGTSSGHLDSSRRRGREPLDAMARAVGTGTAAGTGSSTPGRTAPTSSGRPPCPAAALVADRVEGPHLPDHRSRYGAKVCARLPAQRRRAA